MSPQRTAASAASVGAAAAVEEVEGKPTKHWIMGVDAFERRMPHHDGIKALWETKWKFPCTKSVYPFHDGQFEDFEPIFNHLIEVCRILHVAPGRFVALGC